MADDLVRSAHGERLTALLTMAAVMGCSHTPSEPPAGDAEPLTGPYLGHTPPGTIAEVFAPGLTSTGLHDDGPARFNEDGTEV